MQTFADCINAIARMNNREENVIHSVLVREYLYLLFHLNVYLKKEHYHKKSLRINKQMKFRKYLYKVLYVHFFIKINVYFIT